MVVFKPLLTSHQLLFTEWYENDNYGKEELGSYEQVNKWLKLIDLTSRFGWIVTEKDKPIEFVDLEKESTMNASFSFYIAPKYRGQGKSEHLLLGLIDLAKKMNLTTLTAGVSEKNTISQKALKKVGFSEIKRDKDNYLIFSRNL